MQDSVGKANVAAAARAAANDAAKAVGVATAAMVRHSDKAMREAAARARVAEELAAKLTLLQT